LPGGGGRQTHNGLQTGNHGLFQPSPQHHL
jgi:hypothetical protein